MEKVVTYKSSEHEPFLYKGEKYKVIGYYKGQPLIKDRTGVTLRLDKKKNYYLSTLKEDGNN